MIYFQKPASRRGLFCSLRVLRLRTAFGPSPYGRAGARPSIFCGGGARSCVTVAFLRWRGTLLRDRGFFVVEGHAPADALGQASLAMRTELLQNYISPYGRAGARPSIFSGGGARSCVTAAFSGGGARSCVTVAFL